MKRIRLIALISVILGAASCSDDESKIVYTITFEARGGAPVPSAQKVEEGNTITAPSVNPEKTGYVFQFWHVNGSTTAYNFQTPVNGDLTLYAQWQEEATAEYWQVTWKLNDGSWPSEDNHATQVVKGGTLTEPAQPVRNGYTFEGWYKDANLSGKVNFPYDVSATTADITLYAKWEAEGGTQPSSSFTIRNTAEWNNAVSTIKAGGANKSYTLTIEGTVSVPPTVNVKQGSPSTYTFGAGEKLSVTINGSGTLALADKGFLMCLSGKSGAKQKLIIDGPTLQGRSDNVLPLLRLDYADLELKSGKITGNTNNGGGGAGTAGGVSIENGWLTMSGGEISNNTCGQNSYIADGGGAAIKNGSFIMSGGTISGNTGQNGGGVYLYGYNFTMSGGTIKGNTSKSSSPYGGGVYYTKGATNWVGSFTKTGGIIYGYSAGDPNSNITKNYNNIITNHGAAVFCPMDNVIGNSNDKRRENTLGESDNITTDEDAGWEVPHKTL